MNDKQLPTEKRVLYRHGGREWMVPLRLLSSAQQEKLKDREIDYTPVVKGP